METVKELSIAGYLLYDDATEAMANEDDRNALARVLARRLEGIVILTRRFDRAFSSCSSSLSPIC